MKKVVIIAPVTSITGRTRLNKIYRILSNSKYEVSFWGWRRSKQDYDKDGDIGVKRKYLITGGGYNGYKNKFLYIIWLAKVFINILVAKDKKNTIFHCLGFETSFGAYLAKAFIPVNFVYDDADRFSMLFEKRFKVVEKLEQKVSKASIGHIVPTRARYPDFSDFTKFVEIRNEPDKAIIDKAINSDWKDVLEESNCDFEIENEDVMIYANGWLSNARGIGVLLDVARKLNNDKIYNIKFLLAGKADVNIPDDLRNVKYVGTLSYEQSLALYLRADYVFTYYSPDSRINRFAESNKWGDAEVFGVPLIINSELKTAEKYYCQPNIVSEYNDTDKLYRELKELSAKTAEVYSKRLGRQISFNFIGFDEILKQKIYD